MGKQKFTLEYEGRTNVFEVDAISSQSSDKGAPEDLASRLEELRIDPVPRIWIVEWDTTVVLLPADTLKPPESTKVLTVFHLTLRLTSAEEKPVDRHRPVCCGWRFG
jgi:hypothetical protein